MRSCRLSAVVSSLLILAGGARVSADDWARVLSPEIRKTDARLAELAREVETLPQPGTEPQGSRFGFRSETISRQAEVHWVQIDLGRRERLDGFAVLPTRVPLREPGYGFPLRYRIDVADDPLMAHAVTAVDRTAEDVPNPGAWPVYERCAPVEGRYVRISSTKHYPADGGYFWAMEELVILAGNRNVAVNHPLESSNSLELYPNWSLNLVNDGLSNLGMPVSHEGSPTIGYLSESSMMEKSRKWIVIDLLREMPVDEIRLVPVQSTEPEVVGGRGYPKKVAIELARTADFTDKSQHKVGAGETHLGYPFGAAEVIDCGGTVARYVRVAPRGLFPRGSQDLDGERSFALAEVQVYAGGENVALGKPVSVSDQVKRPPESGWAPEFLVDGFNSRHRLIELPAFLALMERRGVLEKERDRLTVQRAGLERLVSSRVLYTIGGTGSVGMAGWLWMLLRRKAVRRRDATQLREQIARDLHDDIGSNLGGILLQSQLGAIHEGIPDKVRRDFQEIRETAEATSSAMRDIVWLVDAQSSDLRELIARMRDCCEHPGSDLKPEITVIPEQWKNRVLSLQFRRSVLLAFKETLHNVRRHAGASVIRVRFEISPAAFAYTVTDDGCGFDPDATAGHGQGLRNLRNRAARLRGRCTIFSGAGRGTTVTFQCPYHV